MPNAVALPKDSQKVSFMLPPQERRELRQLAEREDLSESQVLRRALRLLLAQARERGATNGSGI